MLRAQKFRFVNKKLNMSFFDCAGYVFSQEQGASFVTGDRVFKDMPGVTFVTM